MNAVPAFLPTQGGVGFDGNTVGNWMIDNVVFLLIVIVAITIFTAAVTKRPRDAFVAFGIAMLGMLLISLGAFRVEVGDWLRTTFFSG